MEQISHFQFMKKLGDICDFQGGSQPPKSAWIKEAKDGYIRMLQIRDFTLSRQAQAEYVKIDKKLKICERSDILLGRYGASVGKVLTGLAGAYNVAIMKSIPQKNSVLPKYLKLYFMSDAFQNALQKVCVTRSAQAGFSKEDIYDFPIYVPSLAEQERIVKKLDDIIYKIDCIKANAEFTLSATKDLYKSYLDETFTKQINNCKKVKMSELAEVITKGSSPKWQGYNYCDKTDKTTLFITSENVGNGKIILDKLKYLPMDFNNTQRRSILQKGDILTNIVGASIGRTAIFDLDECSNINQAVCLIRLKDKRSNNYIVKFMNTTEAINSMLGMVKDCARANVSLTNVSDLYVPMPSLEEQNKIVKDIDTVYKVIEQLEEILKHKLKLLDDLKQSILKQAFAGEL